MRSALLSDPYPAPLAGRRSVAACGSRWDEIPRMDQFVRVLGSFRLLPGASCPATTTSGAASSGSGNHAGTGCRSPAAANLRRRPSPDRAATSVGSHHARPGHRAGEEEQPVAPGAANADHAKQGAGGHRQSSSQPRAFLGRCSICPSLTRTCSPPSTWTTRRSSTPGSAICSSADRSGSIGCRPRKISPRLPSRKCWMPSATSWPTPAQQFVAVLLAKSNYEFAEQLLKTYQQTVGISQEQQKAGAISKSDLLKIQLQTLQFQTDVTTAKIAVCKR